MAFWTFMFVCNILVPVTMIVVGWFWGLKKRYPAKINWAFGYRSARSTKNAATWQFAHEHCGRIWWCWGWLLLVVTVLAQLPLIGKSVEMIGMWGTGIMVAELIAMFGSLIPTERALKRNFDEYGRRTA